MSKLFSRATVTGTSLGGATLKTTLTALWDALNTIGITDSTRSTITSSATLTTTQCGLVLVDCSAGSVTLTLPTSGATTDELEYNIKRIDTASANVLTVQRGGTDTIEGSATIATLVPPGGIVGHKMPAGATNWRVTNTSQVSPSAQALTAFTSTGSAAAYVLTPKPAIAALTAGQRFRVNFNFATSGACTLAVSGLTATSLKQYDSGGNKVDPVIASGQLADVEYDGANWVLLTPLPALSRPFPAVRQTVLSGPVDSNGLPNFGGSTGSTTVTATGTLIATAANGSDASGNIDRVGSIVNPSWTGLSTNGVMYLCLDVAANGTCTTASTTGAPTYQWGGSAGTVLGQLTFNIQAMSGQVGTGGSYAQGYRVVVGEVLVAGGVVSTITWYALQGRYVGAWTATLPSTTTTTTANHNIGVPNIASSAQRKPVADLEVECTTADQGAAVGDVVVNPVTSVGGGIAIPLKPIVSGNTCYFKTGGSSAFIITNAGAAAVLTAASWKYRMTAQRGW